MTNRAEPITIDHRDSVVVTGFLIGLGIDILLAALAVCAVRSVRTFDVRVPLIIAVAVAVGAGTTWLFWRFIRSRLEISEAGIVVIGVTGRQVIPIEAVMRVEAVDGATLRPRIVGEDGASIYLPVLTLRVSPGKLPVRQLASDSRKRAEENADRLCWSLGRAARTSTPIDASGKLPITWR